MKNVAATLLSTVPHTSSALGFHPLLTFGLFPMEWLSEGFTQSTQWALRLITEVVQSTKDAEVRKKKRRVVQALSLHYTTEPSRHDSFPNLVANGNRSFLLLFGGAGTWLKNDLLSSPLVCIQSDSSVFTVGLNTI